MVKTFIMAFVAAAAFGLLCLAEATAVQASERLVDFHDLTIGGLSTAGIEMTVPGKIAISAIGGRTRRFDQLYAYGWIIDAASRELVWSMSDECDDVHRMSEGLVKCEADVPLKAGKFEIYYYVGDPNGFYMNDGKISINDLGDIISIIGDALNDDKDSKVTDDEDVDELSFTVTAEGGAKVYTPVLDSPPNLVVRFARPEKDEYLQQGFSLSSETRLDVYAIGEYSDSYDIFVDGGWIINADNREKVWSMDNWNTDRAGGASKNRMFKRDITLPAGHYIAYYATDDSHNPGEWNSAPPTDPMNYGLTITTINPSDLKNVAPFDEKPSGTPIIAITRVRDNAFEKQAFTLKKAAKLRILALGERSYSGDDLVDCGWIVDADNMDKVWEMDGDNTEFAGGAAKNCRFDGLVELPAGTYIVYYRTDDSHAYGDWNAARPFDYNNWGISLYGTGAEPASNDFTLLDAVQPGGDLLVNMTGLGDDEDVEREFTITKPTTVRIVALGEGKSNDMYDYGWVENKATGRKIWKMSYEDTRSAGGASKNRLAIETLALEPGTYIAHFVTDDSHSYAEFNASPPDDPERWGITITQK